MWLVIYLNCTMMHVLTNLKFVFDCILPVFCDPIQHNGNVSPERVLMTYRFTSD
jgi:hypothetical protein